MNIKEFKVGQTVYRYKEIRSEETEISIIPCTVTAVGRSYVTIDYLHGEQYRSAEWFTDGLVKKEDWGPGRYLFPSEEAIDRYREKIEVLAWIGEHFSDVSDRRKYSLETLKTIKEALEAGK